MRVEDQIARALVEMAKEIKGIRRALESIDKRLAKQSEEEIVKEARRGICLAEDVAKQCDGCRPFRCEFEVGGGENG